MHNYFLTQRLLGVMYLFCFIVQVVWWAGVIYHFHSDFDFAWIYETWSNAPIVGKLLSFLLFGAAPLMYVYTLFGLGQAGWKIFNMSDRDYAILRLVHHKNWALSAVNSTVPPLMIAMVLVIFATPSDSMHEMAVPIFGFLAFFISFAYSTFPVLHFQEANRKRKEENIDVVIEFI